MKNDSHSSQLAGHPQRNTAISRTVTISARVVMGAGLFALWTAGATARLSAEEATDIPKLQNPFSVAYLKANLVQTKPRMIYNPKIVDQLKRSISSDPVIGKLYQAARLEAYGILDQPVIQRIKTSNAMLDVSRKLLRRINMLGVVYLVERDKIILDRINLELLAVSDFPDWNPPVYLDVAEICTAVSLALDWTLDELPKSTIAKAKKALIEKGIQPSWKRKDGEMQFAWWVNHYNNWNQVCNGGMIAASIAIAEDDPELAANTIKRALNGIPHVLNENYVPDGACPEGVGYWNYATSYAVLTLSMLETSFGSDFGYRSYPGFMQSATYRLMCGSAPSGWYYNYADCDDTPGSGGDVILAWFATQAGESMFYEKTKFLNPSKNIGLSYMTGAALAWMCRYKEKSNEKPPTAWVGKGRTPVAVFTGQGTNGYYFATKGGCGAVSHGNMDAGSFIFELDGVRWSIDPGTQSYMIGEQGFDLWHQNQNSERWQLLTKNNHGHSTLTINGRLHQANGYALVKDYKLGNQPSVTIDMSPAFEAQLQRASRTFTKDSDSSLLIEDEIKPNAKTQQITWQFITQADVEVTADAAILKQNGKLLRIANLSHPQRPFNVVSLDPPPHKLDKRMVGLKRIELNIPVSKQEKDSFKIRIRLNGQEPGDKQNNEDHLRYENGAHLGTKSTIEIGRRFASSLLAAEKKTSNVSVTDTARTNILFIALDDPANKELVDKLTKKMIGGLAR
ncbi:MAG: heparinase II/III family protein [Verrucomicrobiota bacterium]